MICAGFLLILVLAPRGSEAAGPTGCRIGLTAQPVVVNFPYDALPSPGGVTFGEVLDVNYSSSLINQTVLLQFFNGSEWVELGGFTANSVGFTEVDYGLNNRWARFGTNSVRAVGGGCASSDVTFSIRQDPGAAWSDAAVYAGLATLSMGFFFLGKKLGWGRYVFLAGGVYLAIAPFTGQRYDIYFLLSSGIRILQHVNPFDPGNPPLYPGPLKWAYPPLYAVYSAFSFVIFKLATGAQVPSVESLTYAGWLTSTYNVYLAYVPAGLPLLVALLKLPMIASAVMTGSLLRRMTGDDRAGVWWLANPLVILVAAIWGQLDPIATLLAMASIYAFEKGKPYHAYLLASLGAAIKFWPALLIPMMFAVSLRRSGLKSVKPLSAVLPAAMITVMLYAVFGNPFNSLFVLAYARGIPTFAGAFSVNGLTWQELLFVLRAPPVPLFLLIGLPAYFAILVRMYRKDDGDIAKWAVVSILVLFLTYNYVNPQYFYWIVPLLILQGRRRSALVFSALPLCYVALSYNLFYFVSPAILRDEFSFDASILEQLKVGYFYQMGPLFVIGAGMVPTVAYVWLAYREVSKGHGGPSSGTTA